MFTNPSRRWAGVAAVALGAAMLSATPLTTAAAEPGDGAQPLDIPAPAGADLERAELSPTLDLDADGPQTVFVQIEGAGAADVAASTATSRGAAAAEQAASSRRTQVENAAASLVEVARGADSEAGEVFTVANAVPGVAISTDAAGIAELAERPEVVKISAVTERTLDNSSAAQLVRANSVWGGVAGNTGEGVKIGVIDTGLDYTHATFGGEGTVEAFEAAEATSTEDGWRESLPELGQLKVAGGYDFVGDDYNADSSAPSYNPIPAPDSNPLDCEGHGTHVAGSAGGYGVNADGSTYADDYAAADGATLDGLKIGPGMAPRAELYGLRVFGCEGSTDQVIAALDWALDPNGDGDFSDHLDIVNMSLGSAYVPSDDPQNDVVDALTRHGVLTVASNGNEGDVTDAGGSPGSATSSLAVASSVDAGQLRDGINVLAPAGVAGVAAGQFAQAYDWAASAPVSGTVATIPGDNADGCEPFSAEEAARVDGKVAWLEWDDTDATRRCGSVARGLNAREAGAVGALFTSELDVFGAGISGDTEIPIVQLTGSETDRLRPSAEAGTLEVEFDAALAQSIKTSDPEIADTISGFTSRGGHGTYSVVKPDVAAPGDTISSAGVGTGSGVATLSGTSMAAPVTAGVAALVLAQHPGWTPLQVKAAVMNTAVHDLYEDAGQTGDVYGPARVGAGRIDALGATTTTALAYSPGDDNPVSATFGVVSVPAGGGVVTRTKTVTVANTASRAVTYQVAYQGVTTQPGVSYAVSARSVTVPARSTRNVTVTMRIDPAQVGRTIDPTMDVEQLSVARQFVSMATGRVTFTTRGSTLRVPVHGTARATSTTTSSLDGSGNLVLTGQGVNQGRGSGAQRSLVSVLELGAESGQLPVCLPDLPAIGCVDQPSDRGMDIEAVGAGATDDYLWFGLDVWGDWATVGRASIPFVQSDLDGDGVPDVETYLQFFADTDVLYSITVDLNTGETLDQRPVNFFDAQVDTNVFDTDVVLLPVSKEALGLPTDGSSAPITYYAAVYDANVGGTADGVGPVDFDAGQPAIATAGPLFVDSGNARIDLTGTGGAEALVVHLYGAPGARTEILEVPAVD